MRYLVLSCSVCLSEGELVGELLLASSSSSAPAAPGSRDSELVQESLQSEHFQLCKVGFATFWLATAFTYTAQPTDVMTDDSPAWPNAIRITR